MSTQLSQMVSDMTKSAEERWRNSLPWVGRVVKYPGTHVFGSPDGSWFRGNEGKSRGVASSLLFHKPFLISCEYPVGQEDPRFSWKAGRNTKFELSLCPVFLLAVL